MPITLGNLRTFAVARSFFKPATLKRALERMGFVQADPIRAPARAQDLILHHRVKGYRAGDLERLYVNLGLQGQELLGRLVERHDPPARRHALPRAAACGAPRGRHPDLHRAPARAGTDRPGGAPHAARRAGRRGGPHLRAAARPESLVLRAQAALCRAAVAWRVEERPAAKERFSHARIDGVDWYWPAEEDPVRNAQEDTVRFLTPFDPVVHDRERFERLWGWVYRFEAYTPAHKRKRGYYALPLLWRDRVIGWGNLSVKNGDLQSELGYVESPPRARVFKRELGTELDRIRAFLGLGS